MVWLYNAPQSVDNLHISGDPVNANANSNAYFIYPLQVTTAWFLPFRVQVQSLLVKQSSFFFTLLVTEQLSV